MTPKRKRLRAHLRWTIGDNLRSIRKKAGMTQREAARIFAADESYYRQIESGNKDISLPRLVELADAFGVTAAQILEGI